MQDKNTLKIFVHSIIIGIIILLIIIFGQWIGSLFSGSKEQVILSPLNTSPALIITTLFMVCVLIIKYYLKVPLPLITIGMFLAIILSLPIWPFHKWILATMNNINFVSTLTPILAVAGLSLAHNYADLRKAGWKLIIVALFVFSGTFFLSAIIAHLVLKWQGLI